MYLGWMIMSVVFYGLGGYAWVADKPVRFWNIAQQIQVCNIKKYNRAVAKMWVVFAFFWNVTGLPLLLAEQNSVWIVFSILGGMAWSIALMVVYAGIEKRYRIY